MKIYTAVQTVLTMISAVRALARPLAVVEPFAVGICPLEAKDCCNQGRNTSSDRYTCTRDSRSSALICLAFIWEVPVIPWNTLRKASVRNTSLHFSRG